MKGLLLFASVLLASCATSQEIPSEFVKKGSITLVPPTLTVASTFFSQETSFTATHPLEGATVQCQIHTKNAEAQAIQSSDLIRQHATVECRATHPDFQESEAAVFTVRNITLVHSWYLSENSTQPSEKYSANGVSTLKDRKNPTTNFSADWLGFDNSQVELNLNFYAPTACEFVSISSLIDHRSWIFEPVSIKVLDGNEVLATLDIPAASSGQTPYHRFYDLAFEKRKVETLSIQITTASSIPDWHPGKGLQGWFFIGELLVE